MATKIRVRRGTAAQWTAANPTLAIGEYGYETDTKLHKIGDGVNPWATLGYSGENADSIGAIINDASSKEAIIDADLIAIVDTEDGNAVKKNTFTQIKAFLKTYFDTLYNDFTYVHPNHTGDVTSSGDGATTIAAKAVTLAKMDDMATASLIYRKTAETGVPEVNTLATLKTDLGLTDTNSGDETATTIGAIINGATSKETPIDNDIVGFVDTEASNVIKKSTWANIKAFLKTYFDTLYNNYVHPNHTGDVTSTGDGGTTIATKAVTLSKMADMATASLIYRRTSGTGVPEVNTLSTLRSDLLIPSGFETGTGTNSVEEGTNTAANGSNSHAEGQDTVADENNAHAEGYNTHANGVCSHAEGHTTEATSCAHSEGQETLASGWASHVEGYGTTASGSYSHAEGEGNTASGSHSSHAEGYQTTASGNYGSHAEGSNTIASGAYSHAGGYKTTASHISSTVIGLWGDSPADYSFSIANGASAEAKGLAFKVLTNGAVYADGSYTGTGADYAEFFEWEDGNPDATDRVGYFVTLDGEKISIINDSSDYVLGVISSVPVVIGDGAELRWNQRYITDDWGRVQYEEVIIPAVISIVDGIEVVDIPERTELQPIQNPMWDNELEYIPRRERKEWDAVGLVGKLFVRDDGTCIVNGYCKPNTQGVATISESGYRVIKRVSTSIVQILFK